jgi:hypothetical protein
MAASVVLGLVSSGLVLVSWPILNVSINPRWISLVIGGYGLLLATSGVVVRGTLSLAGAEITEAEADTGRAIGKIENVLILTLTLYSAYTALGLVFTAKSIVRWQDITSEDTTYYLTGSIANVTYSFVYGVALAGLVPGLPA